MSKPLEVEVAVVGGGIIGLSVAFELVRRSHSVAVIEAVAPGSGATAVAAGMLAAASEAEPTQPDLGRLALASAAGYPAFVSAVEAASGQTCGFDTKGSLLVALDRDHLDALHHSAAEQRNLGLSCEELSGARLRELEPRLSPRAIGGFRAADDFQVDPRRLASALHVAMQRAGAPIVCPARVVAATRPAAWHLNTNHAANTEVHADTVVLAAGAWSVAAFPGAPSLPLRPVKGQVLRLFGERQLQHVVRTPDVYLLPRADGELVVGASSDEQGFDERALAGPVRDLLEAAWRVVPGIAELELRENGVGFRPALRDHLPAIGHVAEGLIVATGHYRNGILLAPETARIVADLVDGDANHLPETLQPNRFVGALRSQTC